MNQCGVWFNAGGSSTFPGMGSGRQWSCWLHQYVDPLLSLGVRRICMHNPFGQWHEPSMSFRQAMWSVARGSNDVPGFAPAWSTLLRYVPDAELVLYIGSKDVPHKQLWEACLFRWLHEFVSVGVHHRVTVALDAASGVAEDSPQFAVMMQLRQIGFRVGVEAMMKRSSPHLLGLDTIMLERFAVSRRDRMATEGDKIYTTAEVIEAGGRVMVGVGPKASNEHGVKEFVRSEHDVLMWAAKNSVVVYGKVQPGDAEIVVRMREELYAQGLERASIETQRRAVR